MSILNCYKALGLTPGSSEQEIRDKYKELLKLYHPDKCSGKDANRKVLLIKNAYKILKKHSNPLNDSSIVSDNHNNKYKFFVQEISVKESLFDEKIVLDIPIEQFCESCGAFGECETNNFSFCYECNGTGNLKSSYGVMTTQKKCDICDGTGKKTLEQCNQCHGIGIKKDIVRKVITKKSNIFSGNQIKLKPVLGDAELDSKCEMIICSFNIDKNKVYKNLYFDDSNNIVYNLNLDTISSIIGGEYTIEDLKLNINLKELTKNNDTLLIEKERSPFGKELLIKIKIEQVENITKKQIEKIRQIFY
jgi:molecular chaperone DnaJ